MRAVAVAAVDPTAAAARRAAARREVAAEPAPPEPAGRMADAAAPRGAAVRADREVREVREVPGVDQRGAAERAADPAGRAGACRVKPMRIVRASSAVLASA